MNKEYLKYQERLYTALTTVEKVKLKIIENGRLREARQKGERFQMITEDEKNMILDSLDQLYTLYGKVSSSALSLQAECVLIKKEFQNNLRTADEMGGK